MRAPGFYRCVPLAFLIPGVAMADIVTDGSVGPAQALPGPAYTIAANLGTQVGSNLFHSFSSFNLANGESATFTGPDAGISTVVSRVTGGTPSSIDGTLRSTIPGATLWFINPAGVMFGANAALDVPAAFHASTANELRSNDGAAFSASDPGTSTLSSAPIESFGFTGPTPAVLTVQGATLQVSDGSDMSLIGGDITIDNGNLWAFGERLNVVAAGSAGTVVLDANDLTLSGFATLGQFAILRDSFDTHGTRADGQTAGDIDASGPASGIAIRADGMDLRNAAIFSDVYGTEAGRGLDIRVSGNVSLRGSVISTAAFEAGDGGDLSITATHVLIDGTDSLAALDSETYGSGNGGDIHITANDLCILGVDAVTRYAGIFAGTQNYTGDTSTDFGDAGSIRLDIRDTLQLVGEGSYISANSTSNGMGGEIILRSNALLIDGGSIDGRTFSSGRGATIDIVSDSLTINGGSQLAGLFAGTNAEGDAGDIRIFTRYMQIGSDDENSLGGLYSNSLVDPSIPVTSYGRAGNIDITATDTLLMTDRSDLRAGTNTDGNGGNINIHTAHFRLEGGNVSVNSSGTGLAGDILITAGKLTIDGTPVNVSGSPETPGIYAASVSSGGSIAIHAGQIVLDNGAQISASVTGDASSAGGNVTLTSDTVVVLDGSRITANATQGRGGRIVVDTEAFIRDAGSDDVLDASSGSDVRERQGTVNLQVDVDIGREIGSHDTQTSSGSVNGSPCAQDRRGSYATLAKAGIGGLPADNRPEGLTGSFAEKISGKVDMVGSVSVDAVIRQCVLVSGRQADPSSTPSNGCLL